MIKNSNIDLTENNDFSKSNPLVVHVEGNTINHPRIPWKINKSKSYLNSFYANDGDFNYSQPIHFTLSNINNSYNWNNNTWYTVNSFSHNPYSELQDFLESSSITYTTSNTNNIYTININKHSDDFFDSISYAIQAQGIYEKEVTDIFGIKRKVDLYKYIAPRIPSEFKKNNINHYYSLNRLPKIFKKNTLNNNKYFIPPEELYGRENNIFSNHKYYGRRNTFMNKKSIPWRNNNNEFIRVGKRTSERGIVYYS